MPGPTLTPNRKDRLIDKLYSLYDAMHHIDSTDEISVDVRNMIKTNLQIEIGIVTAELSDSTKDEDNEFEEGDNTLVSRQFVCERR